MSVYVDKLKNARINGAGQNNGGVLGGIGYLTEKLALGTVSGFEGMFDYTVGGLAKLFGADEFAEDIFDDDWLDYGHADEWYDPSEGWKFAGDVAGGIGTSMPSIAGAVAGGALIAASGGTAAPAGIKLIGASLAPLAAGLSGAGNATKDAFRETGVLTGKEFGYGALTGATEAGLEALTGGIGKGTARIAKNIVKSMAKETGETITKLGAKSVFKTLAGDFVSEAFEEGLAELLSPQYQRMTYNPDAKNATAEEIWYAALVGGLSGVVMGGSAQVVSTGSNLISGNRAVENGNADSIMKTAQYFADFEAKGETGYESFKTIKEVSARLSESLLKTNGQVSTVSQKIMLGQLQRANVAASVLPFVENSAEYIVFNADSVLESFNSLSMTDENGRKIKYTKDELLAGIRTDLLQKPDLTKAERRELVLSIRKSVESGGALSKLAVMDATGRITMSTKRFSESIMHGRKIKSADELNRFVEKAKPEEINALSSFLGIEDWRRETLDSINRKIDAARADGKFTQLKNEFKAKKGANSGIVLQNAGIVPNNVPNIVPQNKNAATRMNLENMQVTGERSAMAENTSSTAAAVPLPQGEGLGRSKIDLIKETNEIDAWAAEKVPEYMKLSEPNRRAVRATVRQARAAGISETSARTMARVAARSGLNVVFDFEGLRVKGDDGLFDGSNTIFLNPSADGQRLARSLLLHEAGHALIMGNSGTKAGDKAIERLFFDAKKIDEKTATRIRERYEKYYKEKGLKASEYLPIVEEEVFMHHLEDVLGRESAWEYILSEDASIGQRFLSFLKRSAQVYSDSDALSSESRRLLRDYKKLFESFAERNYQRNAVSNTTERNARTERSAFAGEKANNANKSILNVAKKMVADGADSETIRRETGWFKSYDGKWRFEIDDSKMEISTNGKLSRDPDIRRYAELVDKVYFEGTATVDEQTELKSLDEKIGDKKITPEFLGDLISHPTLFDMYPQLKDIGIYFADGTDNASYHSGLKEIALPKRLKLQPAKLKKTLIHEIQHAIQDIEGFAEGGNIDSSKSAIEEVMDIMELTDEQKKVATLDMLAKYSDSVKRPIYNRLSSLSQQNGYESVKEYIKSLSGYSYYERIAGEVEARDVSARIEMDPEQRKNTRPDIDRTDVVFADGEIFYDVAVDNHGHNVVVMYKNVLENISEKPHQAIANNIANHIGEYYTIFESGQKVYIGEDLPNEYTQSEYTKNILKHRIKTLKAKNQASQNLGEMIEIATNRRWEKTIHTQNKDAKYGFYRYTTRFAIPVYDSSKKIIDANIYNAEILIRNASDGKKYLYDIVNIKKENSSSLPSSWIAKMSKNSSNSLNNSISHFSEKSTENTKKSSENVTKERHALPEEDVEAFFPEDGKAGTEENGPSRTPVPTGDSEKGKAAKRVPSRGEVAKRNADMHSDRVYNRKEIFESLKRVLPGDITVSVTDELWEGLNSQRNAAGRRAYIESMIPRVNKMLIVESSRFENADPSEIKEAEGRVAEALAGLLSKGTESKRVRLDAAEKVKAAKEKAADRVERERQRSADVRDKATEKVRAAREKAEKTVAETRAKADEKIANSKTAIATRDARDSARRSIARLNRRLLHPTKERNIPHAMQTLIADALSSVNMDTATMLRWAETVEEIEKLQRQDVPDYEKMAELALKRDKIESETSVLDMKAQLDALKAAYDSFKDSEDVLARNAYDEDVAAKMEELKKIVGNTPLTSMKLEQVRAARDFYNMLLARVNNANKLFADQKKQRITDMGDTIMKEISSVHVPKMLAPKTNELKLRQGERQFLWQFLKPGSVFEVIGSPSLCKAFDSLRRGEDVWARDIARAKNFSDRIKAKYHYYDWCDTAFSDVVFADGSKLRLSVDQVMSLYAYTKRVNSYIHLSSGGFVLAPDTTVKGKLNLERYVNDSRRYSIPIEDHEKIEKLLTEEQRKYADEMQAYLSKDVAADGNEVSLQMYGIKIFTEENYFPMVCASEFLDSATGKTGDVKIKNKGMTKEVQPNAKNPLVLRGFEEIWGGHVNDMALYHGMVLPMEDMNRLLNYRGDLEVQTASSMKELIRERYGTEPIQYIEQLMRDLNGGVRSNAPIGLLDKGMSLYKKTAVAANLSVTFQQPSAIARAFAVIEPKYFVAAPAFRHSAARWAELQKYAPVAIIKEMGGFDTGTGQSTVSYLSEREYKGKDKIKGFVSDSNYRDKVFGYGASKADQITWIQIWEACKREQKAKNPKLAIDSDELLTRAGKRFTEVITRTQVYDSTLSRSGMMRSKDTGWKMATAFMAEPTTTMNQLILGFVRFSRDKNKKALTAVIGSILSATVINAALASLVYATRDDDEEKTWGEKYVTSFVSKTIDQANPFTMIPFVKDIWSIAQGYDVERSDMAVIADFYSAIKDFGSEKKTTFDKAWDFTANLGSIFGLPTRNIMRDFRGIVNTVHSAFYGEKGTATGYKDAFWEGVFGKTVTNGQSMYDALLSGKNSHYERVRDRYEDENEADTALRTALRDNDKRIEKAAIAKLNGDTATYNSIIKEITAEGYFTRAFVIRAVTAEYSALRRDIEELGETAVFVDGALYKLTEEQESKLIKKRESLQEKADKLTESKGFLSLNEDMRIIAIEYAQDLIEDVSEYSVLGIDRGKSAVFADAIGIDKFAVFYAKTKGLESDKDSSGKAISGSKKRKVLAVINSMGGSAGEKLLMLASRGYGIQDGDIPGMKADFAKKLLISYILKLPGKTSKEKAAIAEACGFTVVNGRIKMGQ